jgi:hypothetical protein
VEDAAALINRAAVPNRSAQTIGSTLSPWQAPGATLRALNAMAILLTTSASFAECSTAARGSTHGANEPEEEHRDDRLAFLTHD